MKTSGFLFIVFLLFGCGGTRKVLVHSDGSECPAIRYAQAYEELKDIRDKCLSQLADCQSAPVGLLGFAKIDSTK